MILLFSQRKSRNICSFLHIIDGLLVGYIAKSCSPMSGVLKLNSLVNSIPDLTPPKIILIEPQVKRGISIVKANKTIVKGIATDESGVYEVLVNGQKTDMLSEEQFEAIVFLRIGDNKITIKAKDFRGNTSTEIFNIERESQSTITHDYELNKWYSNQHAVVVGIDYYQNSNINILRNAVRDAKAIAGMLKNKMDFIVTELYDDKATKKGILNAISTIKTGSNDSFLFYFAGHGRGITVKNNPQGYIIPYDASIDMHSSGIAIHDEEAIPLNRLRLYIQDLDAKHIALILDSCFSGLVMKRSYQPDIKMNMEYYNDLLSRKAVNILTAGDNEPVSDGAKHSPFTTALLNALDKGNIDIHDRDGFATFNQLAVYVKGKVEKNTNRRQRPQFDNLSMDDGEFVFKLR